IDSRLVIKPVEITARHQLNQVAVPFQVFTQQHKMVIAVGFGRHAPALLGYISLAADDGLDAALMSFIVELNSAEKIPVVRHRHRRHVLLLDQFHELLDFAGSVQQGVVCVAVQMYEGGGCHGEISVYPNWRFTSLRSAAHTALS